MIMIFLKLMFYIVIVNVVVFTFAIRLEERLAARVNNQKFKDWILENNALAKVFSLLLAYVLAFIIFPDPYSYVIYALLIFSSGLCVISLIWNLFSESKKEKIIGVLFYLLLALGAYRFLLALADDGFNQLLIIGFGLLIFGSIIKGLVEL